MKSILKRGAGAALMVALAFAVMGCQPAAGETHTTHTWDEGKVVTAETCTTDGKKTYTCKVCGTTKDEVISKGHKFGEYVSNNDATRLKYGTKTRTCSVCGEKDTKKDESTEPVFVLVPAGRFIIGSNSNVQKGTLTKSFYMCDHEVTQGEYEAVMGNNPSYYDGGDDKKVADGEVQRNRPVEQVNWYMTIVYCNKRSLAEGLTPCYTIKGETDPAKWGEIPSEENDVSKSWDENIKCNWNANGYRLPTSAEWEYSARAGDTSTSFEVWSGTNSKSELKEYAWIPYLTTNLQVGTHEVKKKKPNAWGLYDMTGNVAEWCWDLGYPNYNAQEEKTDPRGNVYNTYYPDYTHVYRDETVNGVDYMSLTKYENTFTYYCHRFRGFRVCCTAE